MKASSSANFRRGQVAVYLLMTLVVVFMLALLGVDVFLAVRTKNRIQNGGDAAALAAAHRQGELINEIGHLNIRHIAAAIDCDTNECEQIVREQRRLALIEPVYALRRASDAAKENGMEAHDSFARILADHVRTVRTFYSGGNGDQDPYPESYPGAWTDYANAIADVTSEGLAACADNIEFYYDFGSHLLLNPAFYAAIAGEDWCWFLFHAKGELDNYTSHRDWGEVPVRLNGNTVNSEIFSLHVDARKCALTKIFTEEQILKIANGIGGLRIKLESTVDENGEETDPDLGLLEDPEQTWFFFDTPYWNRWFEGRDLIDEDGNIPFPIVGTVKEEYNVRGCAAVCRTMKDARSFTTDTSSELSWNAAAKPFGTVETFTGDTGPVTVLSSFVVPCIDDVRLVSVDMVNRQNLGTADIGWITHIRYHLQDYLLNGPKDGGCYYCAQLVKWERESFHKRGTNWLKYNSGQCIRPLGNGGFRQGGTMHGH